MEVAYLKKKITYPILTQFRFSVLLFLKPEGLAT